jgi:pimeloyl-ACP methyl ester carboxylesterase
MTNRPSLVLLPGLGADRRLFRELEKEVPGLIVPDWPPSPWGDGIDELASRLVPSLPADRPLFLGGSSFGGFVALRLARLVPTHAVVLIGSCRKPGEIPFALRCLAPAAGLLPSAAFRAPPLFFGRPLARLFGAKTAEQQDLFLEMLRDASPDFIRWGVRAISRWREDDSRIDAPVVRIHGGEDRVLPLGSLTADLVIPGAGHLVPMTHPREVGEFLAGFLATLDQRVPS